MTANAFDEDKHRIVLAGMNAHVGKPFDVDRLYDTIEDVLIEKERYVHHDALEAFREKYQQLGCLCGFFVYRAGFDEQIIYAVCGRFLQNHGSCGRALCGAASD